MEAEIREHLIWHLAATSEVVVHADTLLSDEGVLDSMGFVQLVAHVEEMYGVTFDEEELESSFDTVNNIAAQVAKKVPQRA